MTPPSVLGAGKDTQRIFIFANMYIGEKDSKFR
jgi:hypothetical protein